MEQIIYFALGGFFGAPARFFISGLFKYESFPLGTLVVNALGSFFLGIVALLTLEGNTAAFLATGFLGAFTTFSTFSYETFRMMETGRFLAAGTNILINLIFSLCGFMLGAFISGGM